jgi:hypothetical protein
MTVEGKRQMYYLEEVEVLGLRELLLVELMKKDSEAAFATSG